MKKLAVLLLAAFTFLLTACNPQTNGGTTMKQSLESVVMIKTEWNQLRFKDIEKGSFVLKSVDGTKTYVEGVDYEIDYKNGKIRRIEGTKIPDFSKNYTYGMAVKTLNHDLVTDVTTFHNSYFTVYAEYNFNKDVNETYDQTLKAINATNNTAIPQNVIDKINNGEDIVLGVIGDSISYGAEATPGKEYFSLLKDYLANYGPNPVNVTLVNVAVGGDASDAGFGQAQKLYQQCGENEPDLVIIAFGMNDQNSLIDSVTRIPPQQYVNNIKTVIRYISEIAAKEVPDFIVVTSMSPNPIWVYTHPNQAQWHDALREYASQNNIPIADVAAFMQSQYDHGQSVEEIVYSNINHPGNYGHKLYFEVFKSLFE